MSFSDQLTLIRGTNILVGVHGAGLMFIMFAAEEVRMYMYMRECVCLSVRVSGSLCGCGVERCTHMWACQCESLGRVRQKGRICDCVCVCVCVGVCFTE